MLLLSCIAVVTAELTVVCQRDEEVHLSPRCYNLACKCGGMFDLIWLGGVDITGGCLRYAPLGGRRCYRRDTSQYFGLLYLLLRCIGYFGFGRTGAGCGRKCHTQCQRRNQSFGRICSLLFLRSFYFHQILLCVYPNPEIELSSFGAYLIL